MAQSLVTQVDRNEKVKGIPGPVGGESPALKEDPPKTFFQSFCACFSTPSEPKLGANRRDSLDDEKTRSRIQKAQAVKNAGGPRSLLPPPTEANKHKKCLVLDLDETLVHSSFHPTAAFDFQIKVEIDGVHHDVYVAKRPGCDLFLERAAEKYELVIFTASLAKYADPVCDTLDPKGLVYWRLFRDSCVGAGSQFVKDMSILGRPPEKAMILDNSPTSYMFQPEQAIPIESWFDDPNDRMLLQLLPILDKLADCDDCVQGLKEIFQANASEKGEYASTNPL